MSDEKLFVIIKTASFLFLFTKGRLRVRRMKNSMEVNDQQNVLELAKGTQEIPCTALLGKELPD